MLRSLAVLACSAFLTSSAFAHVVYQPVQYQYDAGRSGQKYLYGGSDPRVHDVARRDLNCRVYGVGNLHNFDGGNSFGQPSPMSDVQPIYTDCAPFQEASSFGYTAPDARNEAYANVPLYVRKADLLNNAIRTIDGQVIVPASAPAATMGPMVMPRTTIRGYGVPPRGQIIVIPKRLMDRPVKELDQKPLKVASAAQ
jgi:hypothetical protein